MQSLHVASKEMLASVYCPTVHLGHDLPGHVGPAPAEHTVILQGPMKVRPFSAVAFGANGGVGEGPGGVASVAPRPRKRSVARANVESAWCVCVVLPICRICRRWIYYIWIFAQRKSTTSTGYVGGGLTRQICYRLDAISGSKLSDESVGHTHLRSRSCPWRALAAMPYVLGPPWTPRQD